MAHLSKAAALMMISGKILQKGYILSLQLFLMVVCSFDHLFFVPPSDLLFL